MDARTGSRRVADPGAPPPAPHEGQDAVGGPADVVVVVGADGVLRYVSPALARILGYDPEALAGADGLAFIHPDDVSHVRSALADVAGRGGHGPSIALRVRHRDGSWRHIEAGAADPPHDPGAGGIVAHLRDITARERAEGGAREREGSYRGIFEAAGDGMLIHDLDGRVVEVNPAMCRMLGYARDEFVALQPLQFIRPDAHREAARCLAQAGAGGEARSQWVTLRKDGTPLHVEVHATGLTYRGRPHILSVVRDITERVEVSSTRMRELEGLYRADEALHRSLRLDQVLQALVDVVTDILRADRCAVSVWDEERQRLVVRATSGFGPQTVRHMVYARGEGVNGRVLQTGEPVAVEDYEAWEGRIPGFEPGVVRSVVGVPIRIGGQVFGVFGVNYARPRRFGDEEIRLFQALAQRAALAIENARLYEQAQQAAAMAERQRLARDLHDSVTQSLYSLTLLAEAGRRQAAMGDLGRTQRHLERLGETAQQALREMRLLVYQLRPLELEAAGLASALQQRLEAVERRSGVAVQLLVEGELDLPAAAEEGLYRVAQEALNNALKHARATAVTVTVRADGARAELTVADDGRGFDPAAVRDRGGLGLVGMRERAERLGGALTIASAPDSGTRVSLRLATRRAAVAAPPAPRARGEV